VEERTFGSFILPPLLHVCVEERAFGSLILPPLLHVCVEERVGVRRSEIFSDKVIRDG
jgi:hypothetical protein